MRTRDGACPCSISHPATASTNGVGPQTNTRGSSAAGMTASRRRSAVSRPGGIADAGHVQPPTRTRTIGALVAAGVVAKEPHPQDGRQVLVRTTDDGKALLQATRRRRDEWLTRRLAGLDAHERAVLAEAATILRRVVAP